MGEAFLAAKVGDPLMHTSWFGDLIGGIVKGGLALGLMALAGAGGILTGGAAFAVGIALVITYSDEINEIGNAVANLFPHSEDAKIILDAGEKYNVRTKKEVSARAAGSIPHDILCAELLDEKIKPPEEPDGKTLLDIAKKNAAFLIPGYFVYETGKRWLNAAASIGGAIIDHFDPAEEPPVDPSQPQPVPSPEQGVLESMVSPVVEAKHPYASPKPYSKIECTKMHVFSSGGLHIAQGSKKVLINGQPAARNQDKSTCEAYIDHEQTGSKVRIGGKSVTVRDIKSGANPIASFLGEMIGSLGTGAIRCMFRTALKTFAIQGGKKGSVTTLKNLTSKLGCMLVGEALVGVAATYVANAFTSQHPIHYATGSKLLYKDELDFNLAGITPIVWQRIYCSRNTNQGLLGEGWSLPFETYLLLTSVDGELTKEHLVYYDVTGREIHLGKIEVGLSTYFSDEGFSVLRTDNDQYLLIDSTGNSSFYARTAHNADKLVLVLDVDTFGNALRYHYDAKDRVVSIDNGTTDWGIEIDYHPTFSRIKQVTQRLEDSEAHAVLISYEYNNQAQLVKVTDADGVVTREFKYDEHTHQKLNWHKNSMGLIATYEYEQLTDDEWYIIRHQLWDAETEIEHLVLKYDLANSTLYLDDKNRGQSIRRWNAARLVTEYTNELDETYLFAWDDNENLTKLTDPLGRITQYIYNEFGDKVEEILPNGDKQLTSWHNEFSLPLSVVEASGATWRYEYNKHCALTAVIAPDGAKTSYIYDDRGLLIAQRDAANHLIKYQYNELGQLIKQTDCSGYSSCYFYHSNGLLYKYINAEKASTTLNYTDAGRIKEMILADGRTRQYHYDQKGQLSNIKDFDGRCTQLNHTVRGQVSSVIKPDGNQIHYDYDNLGDLIRLTNENKRAYHFKYDTLGRLKEQVDLIGQIHSFSYNAAGELIKKVEQPALDEYGSKPIVTHYEYDTLSRITSQTVAGNRTEFHYAPTQLDVYRYQKRGSLTHTKPIGHHSSLTQELSEHQFTLIDTLSFQYTKMGQLQSETNHAGTFNHHYDVLGNLIKTELPDGAVFTHLYYGSGHLLESRFSRGDKNFLLAEYTRDTLHREIRRAQGALNLETQYDATGRITRHSLRKTNQSVAFHPLRENRYEYNDVNELISRHILNGDEKSPLTFAKSLSEYFEYDTNGQVLVHSPALEMKYLQEEHYKYDAAGNLITDDFHPPHWTNQTTRHKGQTYHYDGFGRLVQIKRQENVVKQFEYDEHHRMIQSVVKQGNDEWVAQYEYDALSRRISKTSQYYTDVYDHHRTLVEYKSKKQLFYWQGLRLAGESEASHTENRRWYAYEENSYAPLALIDHWHEIDKDEVVYYHNQLNGSPYALSNTQGELIWETETYLWGSYRRPAKNQVTLLYGQPLRFQGQYFDQETGLHYNTFRYYDPETGRFTQQDPIGLAGGINLYQYAPNPLLWIDPLGWKCSSQQLSANKANGKAAEDLVYQKLLNNPNVTVLGRQVYVKTPGAGRGRYVDILIQNNKTGKVIGVEVKSGGAVRSSSQIAKDKIITSGGGVFGKNAPGGLANQSTTGVIINETHVPLWKLQQ